MPTSYYLDPIKGSKPLKAGDGESIITHPYIQTQMLYKPPRRDRTDSFDLTPVNQEKSTDMEKQQAQELQELVENYVGKQLINDHFWDTWTFQHSKTALFFIIASIITLLFAVLGFYLFPFLLITAAMSATFMGAIGLLSGLGIGMMVVIKLDDEMLLEDNLKNELVKNSEGAPAYPAAKPSVVAASQRQALPEFEKVAADNTCFTQAETDIMAKIAQESMSLNTETGIQNAVYLTLQKTALSVSPDQLQQMETIIHSLLIIKKTAESKSTEQTKPAIEELLQSGLQIITNKKHNQCQRRISKQK